jgi:hypothetical protein
MRVSCVIEKDGTVAERRQVSGAQLEVFVVLDASGVEAASLEGVLAWELKFVASKNR